MTNKIENPKGHSFQCAATLLKGNYRVECHKLMGHTGYHISAGIDPTQWAAARPPSLSPTRPDDPR